MSKRLRVTSRVSKKGRSLRPRSFPPRNPASSAPDAGELDFDSTASPGESFPPPDPDDDGEGDAAARDSTGASEKDIESQPAAAEAQPEGEGPAAAASSTDNEPAEPVEQAPASTDAFSGEFFRKETDSVPPSVDASRVEPEDHAAPRLLSPEAIAYQARLRKIVAGVLAGLGVLALAVAGKALLAPDRPSAALPRPVPTVAEVAPPPPPAAPAAPVAPPEPAPAAGAGPDAAAAAEPTADIAALKKETESLMNRGKFMDAIEKARVAIAADPSDALPYLYLGSSLQETGKWKEGVEAYSECVRHATKGPIHECRAMGGRK